MRKRNMKILFKRSLAGAVAVATALGLGLSDSAFLAAPNGNITAEAAEALTITGVEYGSNYVETKATADDTINSPSASSNITAVTLSDGTKVEAKTYGEGEEAVTGVLTLVVDGVQRDILDYMDGKISLEEGNYSFESTKGSVAYSEMAKFGAMGGNTAQYTYRSALMIKDGKIYDDETIIPLLSQVEYDLNSMKNGKLLSEGAFFNGVIVEDSEYSIENVEINYNGDGANDFQGEGSALLVTTSDAHSEQKAGPGGDMPGGPGGDMPMPTAEEGNAAATLNISSSEIYTSGVIRTAAAAKGSGILKIDDSVIYTQETNDTDEEYNALVVPMMKRTPFALGIEGVVRATNILGSAQGIYTDSLIVSSGWGVLSTDSGTAYDQVGTYALDVNGVIAGIGSVEEKQSGKEYDAVFTQDQGTTDTSDDVEYGFTQTGSGYVAYADAGVWDKFENVKFYSDDYVQIMASNKSSAYYTNSELVSGRIAVMTQQNAGGTISIKDSTVKAADTVVQVKSGAANAGYTNVILDNAKIELGTENKWGGTLVELVESDDAGNPGNTTYTVNDTGDSAQAGAAALNDTNATLKNGVYNGNIWNNIYNNTEALNVTVDNATLTGTISSAYGYHLNDDGTRMANGTVLNACTTGDYRKTNLKDYIKIGAQYNVANKQINNPVNVSLTNNSTWNIKLADGTNGEADALYVNDITVEAGSAIQSEVPVTVYYYGTYTNNGTVSDNITFVKSDVEQGDKEDDGTVATCSFYSGTPVSFQVVDENGMPNSKLASVNYKAFTDIGFTVEKIADGYEVDSVTATANGIVTEGNADGFDYTLTEGSTKEAVTVTIQLKKQGGTEPGPATPVSIENAAVSLSQTSYVYDGSAKTPSVTVTVDGTALKENTDFTVSYKNNTNAGTANVTVEGKDGYTGSVTVEFKITRAAQQLTLKPATKTYKVSALKKKAKSFNIKAAGNEGGLTYKVTKYPSKAKKYITVSKKGKVTMKKGAKKGKYQVTVTAAKTSNYKKVSKKVTVTVK